MQQFFMRLRALGGVLRGNPLARPVPASSPRAITTKEGKPAGAPVVGNGSRGVASLGVQDTAATVARPNPIASEGASGIPAAARIVRKSTLGIPAAMPMVTRRSPGIAVAEPPKPKP